MLTSDHPRFDKIPDTDRRVVTKLATKIVQRGMAVPVIFFLEMTKYVAFIGSQTLVFFGPLITAFIEAESYYKVAEIMEERRNVEFLICEIERLEQIEKDSLSPDTKKADVSADSNSEPTP